MRSVFGHLFAGAVWCAALAPASAGTLTDISFKSNALNYINNTIVGDGTSPLAFTLTSNLSQPFLNSADSTASLGFGNYYAIAFKGFGQHLGAGEISFRVNGGALTIQSVTFPDPASASAVFASFALPGGDLVTVAATGLSADRIRIVADGGGFFNDGAADAFYAFNYAAVPEPANALMWVGGLAILGAAVKRGRR